MELELQNDLLEYLFSKDTSHREMMREYFTRLGNFSGVDDFGNALEEIPVDLLLGPTFHHNAFVQAVAESARLYRDFPGLSKMISATQIVSVGRPHIKNDILLNAYSLPVGYLSDLYESTLKHEKKGNFRPVLHIGTDFSFYLDGRYHDVLYKPRKGGRPARIIEVLYKNHRLKPLSVGRLIQKIASEKKLFPQDITSSISDINKAFENSLGSEVPLIINQAGYFFNDRYFKVVID